MKKGKVYLIGAGPGDPELLTLKGKRCLEEADVIVGDYLADPRLLRYAKPGYEYIYVGKKAGCHTMKQHEISELLAEKGEAGKIVARLKGGDPFVFGRGGGRDRGTPRTWRAFRRSTRHHECHRGAGLCGHSGHTSWCGSILRRHYRA